MIPTQTLPNVLSAFANKYRGDHTNEHGLLLNVDGQVVARHVGTHDAVEFDDGDLDRAVGGYVTHSHPKALPVSGADLSLAARYGLTLQAVGQIEDGTPVDYIVRFPHPMPTLADILPRAFDDAVDVAEKQLAFQPYDDRTWQRAARHLAVTRLAQEYGFAYVRTAARPLSEMAHTPEADRLSVLAQVSPVLTRDVFDPLHAQMVRALTRHANAQGRVDPAYLNAVRQIIAGLVQRTFLGSPLQDGSLHPFVEHRGQVVPRSAYFAALWGLMRQAAEVSVERHAALMRKYLPADLQQAFARGYLDPNTALSEADDGPTYDPLHLWLSPDGKELDDRIWQITGDMGRKLDDYLTDAIASGKPVNVMAVELERFLIPGTSHALVYTPYGNVAYEAMRLARTEVSAAGHRADWLAAQQNPFVEQYQPTLSPTHTVYDECDVNAEGGPYPASDPSHLPPRHPECMDGVQWIEVNNPEDTVKSLRERIADAAKRGVKTVTEVLNPLSKRFTDWIMRGVR